MIAAVLTISALLSAIAVQAIPAPNLEERQSITALSTTSIDAFTPYSYYAAAGYCAAAATVTWSCGADCQANPAFIPTASGGNGDAVQYWFVGYDPTLSTVIVSHQGTDASEILPLLEDAEFFLEPLSTTLFPGVSSSIEVHSGFAGAQASTAAAVLAAVQSTMTTHSAMHVTLVGHSLGAAITLLDSIYLPLHLPAGTTFKTVGYGTPRVGNQAFANYVDAQLGTTLTRINNKEDFVPILPGMFLGYHHPSGEVHIQDSGVWDSCPGQDNESDLCTTGDVSTIFSGDESDHDGPYNGVEMSC